MYTARLVPLRVSDPSLLSSRLWMLTITTNVLGSIIAMSFVPGLVIEGAEIGDSRHSYAKHVLVGSRRVLEADRDVG